MKYLLAAFATSAMAVGISGVVHDALSSNTDYLTAKASTEIAANAATISKSIWLPNLTINANTGMNRTKSALNNEKLTADSYGITLNQKLFDMPSWLAVKKQNYLLQASYFKQHAVKQNIIYKAVLSYCKTLEAIGLYESQKAKLAAYKEQLKQVQHEYNAGKSARPKLAKVKSEYLLAEVETLSAKNAVVHAVAKLSQLTGKSYSAVKGLGAKLPLNLPKPHNAQAWVELMLKHNLMLKASRISLLAAQQNIEAVRTNDVPKVSFVSSINRARPALVNDRFATVSQWGVALDWPIATGGRNIASLAQARHIAEQSRQAMLALSRDLTQQTINSFYDVTLGIKRVKSAQQAVVAAILAKKSLAQGYAAGSETLTDLLQSIASLHSASLQLIKAKYDYLTEVFKLKMLVGCLTEADLLAMEKLLKVKKTLTYYK